MIMSKLIELRLKNLGKLVLRRRTRDHLSLRRAGDEIDVSFNVIARLEQGNLPTVESFVKILLWLPETRDPMKRILSTLEAADEEVE